MTLELNIITVSLLNVCCHHGCFHRFYQKNMLWTNWLCPLSQNLCTWLKRVKSMLYGPHLLETDQDSCSGWLTLVALNIISQEGFSPGPLTPRFKHSPATKIAHYFPVVFSVWYIVQNCNAKPCTNRKSLFKHVILYILKNCVIAIIYFFYFLRWGWWGYHFKQEQTSRKVQVLARVQKWRQLPFLSSNSNMQVIYKQISVF